MAKALLGHVGTTVDYRIASELRRLQERVRELEAELAEARAAQALAHAEALDAAAVNADLLTLSEPEPAYS